MALVYVASPYKALVVRESQRKAQAISSQQECLKIMRECEGFLFHPYYNLVIWMKTTQRQSFTNGIRAFKSVIIFISNKRCNIQGNARRISIS